MPDFSKSINPSSSPLPVSPRLEALLARANAKRGRLIFAVDATGSRQPTWDMAAYLQAQMFSAVPNGIDVQLVCFHGDRCQASRWFGNSAELATAMRKVMCSAGLTQIKKVLRHTRIENQRQKIGALILVSDCCEEIPADLYVEAHELAVPAFLFQEGNNPGVAEVYAELARITGGAHCKFDASAVQRLGDLLKAVAAFTAGGVKALSQQQSEAARLLLTQIKR